MSNKTNGDLMTEKNNVILQSPGKRKWSKSPLHSIRRENALLRLENQLSFGKKRKKFDDKLVPHTDQDKARIVKEIAILKARI